MLATVHKSPLLGQKKISSKPTIYPGYYLYNFDTILLLIKLFCYVFLFK